MRVLFVVNSLAPGGTEQSTLLLAPHLRDRGVIVEIVTMKTAEHDLTEAARRTGVSVVRLSGRSFARQAIELRRIIGRTKPDVVHTALFEADQLGRIAAWGTGVPVLSSFVNTPYDPARLMDPRVRRWKLRLVQGIDAFTARLMTTRFHAVSEGVKRANGAALRVRAGKIEVAERGRDIAALGVRSVERRNSVRSALGIAPEAPVVLNLGRQEHQKGQIDLLDAASIMGESFSGLVVLIAGKDGSATESLARRLGQDPDLSGHVRLLGHREDVGDLLVAADVLVISSHFEGTAGVALEAMVLETPIVSTALAGLVGVLDDDRNAVMVERSNPASLAAGISRVIADAALGQRLAATAHQDFLDRFTLAAAADRMADLYRRLSA